MHSFRIAMVAASPFPTSQGSQVLVEDLARALWERGHELHLVTYHLAERERAMPWRVHRGRTLPGCDRLRAGPDYRKPLLDLFLAWELRRVVRRERIDVIHAHNYEGLLVGWLVGRLTGVPVVYHSHTVLRDELPVYFRRRWAQQLARWLAAFLDRALPRRADFCIAISQAGADYMRAQGVPPERVRLIGPTLRCEPPQAVDVAQVRQRFGLGAGPLVIYAGNLDPYQDVDLLLRSFQRVVQRLPQATLALVTSSEPAVYHRTVAALGLAERVRFVPSPHFGAVTELLAAADVAACPRTVCAGYPIKLFNYLALGKPVVVSAGSAKGIEHGVNGWVVPNGDVPGFAEGLIRLLEDRELAERLGQAARQTAQSLSDWSQPVSEIEEIYAAVTARRRRG